MAFSPGERDDVTLLVDRPAKVRLVRSFAPLAGTMLETTYLRAFHRLETCLLGRLYTTEARIAAH